MLSEAQSSKSSLFKDWLLLSILLVGATLRFYHYASWSLSNDELSAIVRAMGNSPREWIGTGDSLDMHPIGVQVFLFVWMKLLGQAEVVVRLPFVLMGIGSIYLSYRIAARWFGRLSGLFSAATISISGYFILYSQLARPYSPGLFFSLFTVHCWTQLVFDKTETDKPWREHLGFLFGMLACMYTHYFSFLFVGMVGVTGLFFVKKQNLVKYLATGLMTFVFYLPHLQFTLEQFAAEGLDWLPKPNSETWMEYILNGFNHSDFLLFPVLTIFFASFIFFYNRWRFTKFHTIALIWFALPFCIAYGYSIYKKPVLQFSVLIFSFPYLIFLLFAYMPSKVEQLQARLQKSLPIMLGLLIATGLYSLTIDNRFYTTKHFGVFKELAENTKQWDDTYGADKITSTININHPGYIGYYLKKLSHQHSFALYSCNSTEDLGRLANVLDTAKTPYFLHAWSTMPNLAETDPLIRTRYPYIVDSKTYFNSAITLYSKTPYGSLPEEKPLFSLLHSFDDGIRWENDSITLTRNQAHSLPYAAYLDSLHEYGPTYVNRLNNMKPDRDSLDLIVSAWVMSPETNPGAELVISFESLKNVYDWHSSKVNYFLHKPGVWSQVIVATHIPRLPSNEDLVKVYLWNAQRKQIFIDDIQIEVRKAR